MAELYLTSDRNEFVGKMSDEIQGSITLNVDIDSCIFVKTNINPSSGGNLYSDEDVIAIFKTIEAFRAFQHECYVKNKTDNLDYITKKLFSLKLATFINEELKIWPGCTYDRDTIEELALEILENYTSSRNYD